MNGQTALKLRHAGDGVHVCLARFARDEKAATSIEYGLIAGLISVAMLGALTLLSTEITATYQDVLNAVIFANS